MTRLIDADAYEHAVQGNPYVSDSVKTYVRCSIQSQPTIDAEPVRHGKWIDIDEQTYTWKVRCSCCGNERSMMSTQGKYPNYCEACGARMDKE